MKLLHFTDTHGNPNILRQLKEQSKTVDLVLMTGDMTWFGTDLKKIMSMMNSFHAPVFAIHGNHEDEEELQDICSKLENITFLHKKLIKFKDWWFGSYATNGLRPRYPDQEQWVAKNAEQLAAAKPLIWLDHPAPKDTTLDALDADWHVGSESLRAFIEKYQPVYTFIGHMHESFGMEDMIGDTVIINSGPSGKIIDLEK